MDQRLEEIALMEKLQLEEEVERRAKEYHGVASIVSWDRLSPASLASLAGCIGGGPLSKVLGRLARGHREARSGLPDLTVWDPASGKARMVEVKGPGDRLSTKQILWVRFLNSVGLPAEVCHVVATGSKGIVGTSSAPTLEVKGNVTRTDAPTLEVKDKTAALVSTNSGQDVTDQELGSKEVAKVEKKKKRVQHVRGRGKHITIEEREDWD